MNRLVKIIANLMLMLTTMIVTACVDQNKPPALKIEVRAAEFGMNGQIYFTTAELTAALRKLPPPRAIVLQQDGGISPARHEEVISAIQDAGIKAPVGFVGNEVFY